LFYAARPEARVAARLEGRKALVTGGSRGIGRAVALAFAGEGADVAIGYRREREKAEEVVKAVEARGRRGASFAADVRDGAAVRAMVHGARDALGGLDVVVANAGVPTRFEPLHEVDPGYFDRVIGIDLYGVFHTFHAALPILREQRRGVVLAISSVAADACGANGGAYVAAKAAVNALTVVAARENARLGVRCNVIAPGLVATDIADGMIEQHGEALVRTIPMGRMGTPEEIAAMAVYLASDDAAWVTGKIFRIDGGQW
jgi:3-oxoacyl-[acyl-carrier protein] reductase